MKKQTKRFLVPFNFDWTYGVEIKKLKEDLDLLEKLGATNIDIEENYGSISINASVERLETDEEYKERVTLEKKNKEHMEARELMLLEKLKLKYEK